MILKGNARSGARKLASHLLNTHDNDHVTLHSVEGFGTGEFREALLVAEALKNGTRCQKEFYSLSINPPEGDQGKDCANRDKIIDAANRAEESLGLEGLPRAIVFHEKHGRQHAHVVWCRIDPDTLKTRNISHDKLKLRALSRALYLENGWEMPRGLMNKAERELASFELSEKARIENGQSVLGLRAAIREAWTKSESRDGFEYALSEHGILLARGRRGQFVAVGRNAEVAAIARATGLRKREVDQRLGDASIYPSAEDAQTQQRRAAARQFNDAQQVSEPSLVEHKGQAMMAEIEVRITELVTNQRKEREHLQKAQTKRAERENLARAQKLRRGFFQGIIDRLTGKYRALKKENLQNRIACLKRDQSEQQDLIERHITKRASLELERKELARALETVKAQTIARDLTQDISPKRGLECD